MPEDKHLRTGSNTEALRLLETDELFQELDRYVPPLALARAFGVDRDEVRHSRLLATLLNPRRHAGAEVMLRMLLREIARTSSLDRQTIERLWAMVEASWSRVSVHRERLFIDVVVEIASAEGAVVFGIENKIDAGEQPEQIARYQEALERAYPGRTAVVVFLTPTGREPTTARVGGPVPALALGYDSVLAAVEEARQRAMHGSLDEIVLSVVAAHLKEDILGDPEVKNLARELWRTHRRALQLAVRHRPQLGDIREPYVELLRERYGEDAEFYYWPERRQLREIKMDLPSWFERGFPFTFMLYADAEGSPHVRVLAYQENYKRHARSLAKWARQTNATSDHLIDEDFSRLAGWGNWRRVLREEDYPPDAALEEQAYDEDTVRAASDAVFRLVEILRPHVDNAQS